MVFAANLFLVARVALSVVSNQACSDLSVGSAVRIKLTTQCVGIRISGNPAALSVSQPVDLQLVVHHRASNTEQLVDGFEFGNETVTLLQPGYYSVRLRSVTPDSKTSLVSMSLRAIKRETAIGWVEAEVLSTNAKRHRTLGEEAIKRWIELGNTSAVGRTQLQRGDIALRAGQTSLARDEYSRALNTCRTAGDRRCLAEAANNRGWAEQLLGNFEASRSSLQEAIGHWLVLGDKTHEGQTRSNVGLLLWHGGEFEQALTEYGLASRLLENRSALAFARVLNNQGLVFTSLGEYELARRSFNKAIALEAGKTGAKNDLALARMNLGRAWMLEGRVDDAISNFKAALGPDKGSSADKRTLALILNNLGQAYLLKSKHLAESAAGFPSRMGGFAHSQLESFRSLAEQSLYDALNIQRGIKDRRGAASSLHHLGLSLGSRDPKSAVAKLTEAVQIRRECALRDDESDSLAALAELELEQGEFSSAEILVQRSITLVETLRRRVAIPKLRASYFARKGRLLDIAVKIALRRPEKEPELRALVALERGRARTLLDILAEDSEQTGVSYRLKTKRDSIQNELDFVSLRLSTGMIADDAASRDRVLGLLQELIDIETQLRSRLRTESSVPDVQEFRQLLDKIPADSALLEFHLGEATSYLWLITANKVRVLSLASRGKIEAAANETTELFGKMIERRRNREKQIAFEKSLVTLSNLLFGSLTPQATLPKRLIIVPDGALHRVPFAALRRRQSGGYLGLEHHLITMPAAVTLILGKKPRVHSSFPKSILAVVDPVFSSDDVRIPQSARVRPVVGKPLSRLPFQSELETITQLIQPHRRRYLRGLEANRANLMATNVREFGVIHVSTHAVIDERIPELSRIILSMHDQTGRPIDGLLHPHQLAAWNLEGSLVVLSACETGLGKILIGEGMLGLSSALLAGGAAQLVLSLAEVDGVSSSVFFSEMYRGILGANLSVEESLTRARMQMANSPRWQDPYHWASFVVIGRLH